MTTEQLNQARSEAWHQAGSPLLTSDDASAWLRETGVSLFLPRPQQLPAAAPSFVEATLGAAHATPSPAEVASATELLHRLCAAGEVIPLNLLGLPGDQPDFLATVETLPFLFALRGDKEWKRGPRGKSSPLTIEVWKLLDKQGPLTAGEVKDRLGRELTESAALRAIGELWSHMRVEPVFTRGEETGWQLIERRYQKEMQAGSTMSMAVALSALVSLYLQSAVAASGEEIEVFLSPLASRSKVREVVKGLTATRQLATLNLGASELFHVEGSLPEFAETNKAEGAVVIEAVAFDDQGEAAGPGVIGAIAEIGEGRRRFVADRKAQGATEGTRPPRTSRPAAKRATESEPKRAAKREGERGPRGGSGERETGGERRPFAPRPGAADKERRPFAGRPLGEQPPAGRPASDGARRAFSLRPAAAGGRRPYGTRSSGAGSEGSFHPREPWKEDSKSSRSRRGSGAESASGPERSGGEERRPSRESGGAGERKRFAPREGGERKSFQSRSGSGGRPFKARSDAKPFSSSGGEGRKAFPAGQDSERKPSVRRESSGDSERRPFAPRKDGKRKPFVPRESSGGSERGSFAPRKDGERKTFAPGAGGRPFKARSEAKPYGERKPFAPRESDGGSTRKPFAPRQSGAGSERGSFAPRKDGERKSFAPRTGGRPFNAGSDAKAFGKRKSFGDGKPFAPRGGGERKPFVRREDGEGGEGKAYTPRASGGGGERRPFAPRKDGERKAFAPRKDGERKSFAPRAGDRPFKPRSEDERSGARPSGARPGIDGPRPRRAEAGRPATGARTKRPLGAARPRTSPVTSSGKPRTGARPPSGRPGPRATRGSAGKGAVRGGVKRPGRPGKGRSS